MITEEQTNHLVKVFQARMSNEFIKPGSKRYLERQIEFFCGAIALLDKLQGNGKESEISPYIYFSLMQGEVLQEREVQHG